MKNYIYQPASIKKISYDFSLSVLSAIKEMPEDKILLSIQDQLIKSSTSIGANVIEGYGSTSEKESKKYFEIAYKSSQKSEYWLSLLRDSFPKYNPTFDSLISDCQTLRSMLELVLSSMEGDVKLYD